jgi:hypothetical protein
MKKLSELIINLKVDAPHLKWESKVVEELTLKEWACEWVKELEKEKKKWNKKHAPSVIIISLYDHTITWINENILESKK